jgi:hypothetical protein
MVAFDIKVQVIQKVRKSSQCSFSYNSWLISIIIIIALNGELYMIEV